MSAGACLTHESLEVVMGDLGAGIIHEQQVLDREFYARSIAFARLGGPLEATAGRQLARQVAPSQLVAVEASVELKARFSREKQRESGIGVRLLNVSYERRYTYSEFANGRLEFTVQRVPVPLARRETTQKHRNKEI